MFRLKKYGRAGLVTYASISILDFTASLMAINAGVNVDPYIQKFKLFLEKYNITLPEPSKAATNVVLAYTVHKMLLPIRLPLTIALTPHVSKILSKKL